MIAPRERRAAPRYAVSVSTRLIVGAGREGSGSMHNVSEKGAMLRTDVPARVGDAVTFYTDGFDRLEGRVVRIVSGGFAVEFNLSAIQNVSIGERIAAMMMNGHCLHLTEKREYSARKTVNLDGSARVDGEDGFPCTLVNISNSGCLIRAQRLPPLGAEILIGERRGRVMRLGKNTFAVRFEQPLQRPRPDSQI